MSAESGPHLPCLIHFSLLAAHYRRLASCVEDPGVATELSLIAQSYEREAAALAESRADEA